MQVQSRGDAKSGEPITGLQQKQEQLIFIVCVDIEQHLSAINAISVTPAMFVSECKEQLKFRFVLD